MDDQDDFGIEKLRVDPALMQRVVGAAKARKSKRKGWQRIAQ